VSTTALIVLLFGVDIAVHLGVTIVVGRWLNKVARTEVLKASASVKASLLDALPGAVAAVAAATKEHERV
jgi:hypothetical protein